MRFFRPRLVQGTSRASSDVFVEKFGGRPWGLPADRWPRCAECGMAQSLIAQLAHAAGRLDLGRDGRVLYVFQCNHDPGMCSTWEANAGANAVVIIEASELSAGPSVTRDEGPEDPEVLVLGWTSEDDQISEEDERKFFDDGEHMKLPEDVLERAPMCTRIGSVPSWVQSAGEGPGAPWRFVVQIDSSHELEDGKVMGGSNFGDGGIAYVFLKEQEGARPEGLVFWQCG